MGIWARIKLSWFQRKNYKQLYKQSQDQLGLYRFKMKQVARELNEFADKRGDK